jgi:hypothetical protein
VPCRCWNNTRPSTLFCDKSAFSRRSPAVGPSAEYFSLALLLFGTGKGPFSSYMRAPTPLPPALVLFFVLPPRIIFQKPSYTGAVDYYCNKLVAQVPYAGEYFYRAAAARAPAIIYISSAGAVKKWVMAQCYLFYCCVNH